MNCDLCRDWLLQTDDPSAVETAPLAVAAHVRSCDACQDLMCDLVNLEQRWRALPLPVAAEPAKNAFLERLDNPPSPHAPGMRRWRALARFSLAAMLFVGLGAGVLFLWPASDVDAHPDLLDELIDWNLEISETASPVERERIYQQKGKMLSRALRHAKLNDKERALAESLLDNGAWMAANEDPVEELDRYQQVADQLLDNVRQAGPDAGRSDRFAKQFRKINEKGVEKSLQRIKPEKIADPARKMRFNKLLHQDADRAARIQKLVENAPDMTKKELRRALELKHKRKNPDHEPRDKGQIDEAP
jgi:hypothetical protein